jgi:hypothetical protein
MRRTLQREPARGSAAKLPSFTINAILTVKALEIIQRGRRRTPPDQTAFGRMREVEEPTHVPNQ